MFDKESKALLRELSKNTMDIGRKINSPKNDVDDLQMLAEGLVHVANALLIVVDNTLKNDK